MLREWTLHRYLSRLTTLLVFKWSYGDMRRNARSQISTEASYDCLSPLKSQLPCSFLQMRYGVGRHRFFGQPKPMLLHNWILKDGSSLWHMARCDLDSILHCDLDNILVGRGQTQILPVISNFTQGSCGFVCLFVFTLLKLYLRVLGGSVGFKLKCEGLRLDSPTPM